MLGITAILVVMVLGHSSGLFGPAKPGTTPYRLLNTPLVALSLLIVVALACGVLLSCRPSLRAVFGGYFAGLFVCASFTSAMYFDSWLSVYLMAMAAPLFMKAASTAAHDKSKLPKARKR